MEFTTRIKVEGLIINSWVDLSRLLGEEPSYNPIADEVEMIEILKRTSGAVIYDLAVPEIGFTNLKRNYLNRGPFTMSMYATVADSMGFNNLCFGFKTLPEEYEDLEGQFRTTCYWECDGYVCQAVQFLFQRENGVTKNIEWRVDDTVESLVFQELDFNLPTEVNGFVTPVFIGVEDFDYYSIEDEINWDDETVEVESVIANYFGAMEAISMDSNVATVKFNVPYGIETVQTQFVNKNTPITLPTPTVVGNIDPVSWRDSSGGIHEFGSSITFTGPQSLHVFELNYKTVAFKGVVAI